jgi:hypothetical protein
MKHARGAGQKGIVTSANRREVTGWALCASVDPVTFPVGAFLLPQRQSESRQYRVLDANFLPTPQARPAYLSPHTHLPI